MKLFQTILNRIKKLFQKEDEAEYVVTQFIYSDKQPIDGKSRVSFFVNNPEPDVSVTRTFKDEDEAINWLMADTHFKIMLFENLFSESKLIKYHCGVKEPITIPKKMPGDIDILLYEEGKESSAIGIECKIVKSESRENQPPKINKVSKVQDKGTKQANGYAEIGFRRVYLLVIILDDGRNYKNKNVMFRTTSSEWLNELYGIDWETRMNDDIGIIYVFVNQFTSNHINQTKGLGLRIEREAKKRKQSDNLTEKIKNLKE